MSLAKNVLETIKENPGIKSTELAIKVAEKSKVNAGEFMEIIDALVSIGEIVEIEYTMPLMEYRIKSIYFPKESNVVLINNSKK